MASTAPAVAIVGAGLAGLTLAHRLWRDGWEVTVFERDDGALTRAQGYRITADRHGIEALTRSLDPALVERILARSGPPGGHFRITDERLRDAVVVTFDPATASERQLDRADLRLALLDGLGPEVRYGKAATAVAGDDEGVRITFSDGSTVRSDVAVIADGVGSALRASVFPTAAPADPGVGGIYGRCPLIRDGRCVLSEQLTDSGVLALLPEQGSSFFFTSMRFGPAAIEDGRQDYVMWGLVLGSERVLAAAAGEDRDHLTARAMRSVRAAHPIIRELVATSDPASTLLSRFAVGRRPGPAALSHVAVLGDAIHPMPPFGAHGGNTALRDAATLGDALVDAHHGGGALSGAVDQFHQTMRGYAYDAVDDAEKQMRRLGASGLQRWMLRRVLPAVRRSTAPADPARTTAPAGR